MPRKGDSKRDSQKKMRTTEACDERHNTKLLSFCDKKIQGQKENYFDTEKDKKPHTVFAWLVGSHEVGLIGNNESTITSNTLITHPQYTDDTPAVWSNQIHRLSLTTMCI